MLQNRRFIKERFDIACCKYFMTVNLFEIFIDLDFFQKAVTKDIDTQHIAS